MVSVSVAMATFNGQKHIQRQLESLAAQTRIPAELVICDDGSEDDSIAIVENFAKSAPFPVVVHRNGMRLGYRANFMRAAELCRHELIAFSDQDDYWHSNKLSASIQPFNDPEILLVYHNADVVTVDGKRIGTLAARAAPRPILMPLSSGPFWPVALGFTETFRRSLLCLSDLWPLSRDHYDMRQPLGHDQWFFFLAGVFGKIAYIDEPLVAYTQHGSNTFGWRRISIRESVGKHFRNRADEYSQYAKAAENRAAILEFARPKLRNEWRDRADAASAYYRKVSWLLAERNTIYTAEKIADRLRSFRSLLENGGYAGILGLGRKSLAADICFGVMMRHLLRSASQ